MPTAFTVRRSGLVTLFRRCYNALTVWLTGNRLPLAYVVLALEKTPPRNFLICIRRRATRWSLLNWLNFSRPRGKMAKPPNGTSRLPSAFVAQIGRPKRKKPPCVSQARVLPMRRHPEPMNCYFLCLSFLLPNQVCRLKKRPQHLRRSSLPRPRRQKLQKLLPPKRRDTVPAGAAGAAAAIVGKPAPLASGQRFRLSRRLKLRFSMPRPLSTKLPSRDLA